jgi:hypothetical protein
MRVSIIYQPNDNVELRLFLDSLILVLLSMVIYHLTNVDDKFIIIESFS